MKLRKKLIEVALPLEAINAASAREKSIRHGHPSTLHLWWARRPLAAARAVIFAQMVDDPSANPDLFPTEKAQEKERKRLFKIIEELVKWENTNNERVLQAARDEIWQSWRRACADNVGRPGAKKLFNRHVLPAFHDPFAGGGAIPLEAQRLGLESYASDLNPVAVLINKAMIEIPPKFAGKPAVNPEAQRLAKQMGKIWHRAQGLAEDVRYYGKWMRDEAHKRIGHFYPKVEVTAEMAKERPDLKPYVGKKLTVIAWLWARTVRTPNPAFANARVPLVSTFMLCTKAGKEVFVEPVVSGSEYSFVVRTGKPKDQEAATNGTKLARGSFRCVLSGVPIRYEYIDDEANAGRTGARLLAVVAEGNRERLYLDPTVEIEDLARSAKPAWKSDVQCRGTWASNAQGRIYGFKTFADYMTARQLVALDTFSTLVGEAHAKIATDALALGFDHPDAETGAIAYADAVAMYLGFGVDKMSDRHSSLCRWDPTPTASGVINTFSRQALPMTWDYAEGNPFSEASGNFEGGVGWIAKVLETAVCPSPAGIAVQGDATSQALSSGKVISTDPPYYDNICYADLSDFFYVWLRRALKSIFPDLFATVSVPKTEELIASSYRHDNKAQAERFFLDGMTKAMHQLATNSHPAFPVTIYYAFKQAETTDSQGTASTGWETFLEAVIRAGFAITGTWPARTELGNRIVGSGRNALASSIVLVCQPRSQDARTATRREFIAALKSELPKSVLHLQHSNIPPVDLAQAAIGPGMAVFTRYAGVIGAAGGSVSVHEALTLINETLDEILAQQDGDFDPDSRWAVSWFEQSGFSEGEYGVADVLSRAKNTSVDGMKDAGILVSGRGKVRLLKPGELPEDWDPEDDSRLTVWEMVHHLIRILETGGESAAAALAVKLGSRAETARDLAYRLYTICERKKRAQEALSYNALVQSWPEIVRLAGSLPQQSAAQSEMFV